MRRCSTATPWACRALRETIIEHLLAPKGVNASIDNVMIVNGGIETMNLVCQLYIDPGDVILVERPTFIHCVEIFDMFEAICVACEMDDDGLIMEDVERKIKQYHPKIRVHRAYLPEPHRADDVAGTP